MRSGNRRLAVCIQIRRITRSGRIILATLLLTPFLALSVIAAVHAWMLSPVNQLRESVSEPEILIRNWDLIGPFRFAQSDLDASNPNRGAAGLNHDYLADLGTPEGRLSVASLAPLCGSRSQCRYYSRNGSVLLFDRVFPDVTYAVVYSAAIIESPKDTPTGLGLGSSNGAKVWLNGTQLFETANDATRSAFKNDDIIPLHLRRGRNLLLIKVDYKMNRGGATDPWALIVSILPLERMREAELQKADGHLLTSRLLDDCGQFHLKSPAELDKDEMSLQVKDWRGDTQFESSMRVGEAPGVALPSLRNGFYSVDVQIDGAALHDSFYLGDYSAPHAAFVRMHSKASKESQEYIQGEPLIERYRVLTSREYKHPSSQDWQKKLLMVLRDETRAIHDTSNATWTRMAGAHFREYISAVDNSPQAYWLYVPQQRLEHMPLIVVMPYAEDPVRPFLESSLISWPDDLEAVERAAERNGVLVAIVNGRGTIGTAPIGEADPFEVINDIVTTYSIDENRLYLYGVCEGARRALLLVLRYPDVFAAVGAYGPLPLDKDVGPASDIQIRDEDLYSAAPGPSRTAVLLVNGEHDQVAPAAEMLSYKDHLVRKGMEVTIDELAGGLHKQRGLEQRIFPYLAATSRVRQRGKLEECIQKAVSRGRSGG